MATKESNIFKRALMEASKLGCRLFRVNTGMAWAGSKVITLPRDHQRWPGAKVILDPRPFKTGTPAGYSDGTGWTPVVIKPEMVGKTVAVFTAIETKTPTGRASREQLNFIDQVVASGGIAGIVRQDGEVIEIIVNYEKRMIGLLE